MLIIFPHKISSRIFILSFLQWLSPFSSPYLSCLLTDLFLYFYYSLPMSFKTFLFFSLFLFVPSNHFLHFFFSSFSKWPHSTRYRLCVLLQWTFCYPVIRQMRCRTLPCWIKAGCIWRHRVLDKWETINELAHKKFVHTLRSYLFRRWLNEGSNEYGVCRW